MKTLILILVKLLLCSVAFNQTRDYNIYSNEENGGLCSSSIVMFKSGKYIYESGCEASSHISYGNWIRKKDIIKFYPIDNKNFKVIHNVVTTADSDKNITVKVFDINGINITSKLLIGQLVKGKGIYPMKYDSSSRKLVGLKRTNGIIVFQSLRKIFEQPLEIVIGTATDLNIFLNIPAEWIYNQNSDWGGFGEFVLLNRKSKLISFTPHFPPKTVFELHNN